MDSRGQEKVQGSRFKVQGKTVCRTPYTGSSFDPYFRFKKMASLLLKDFIYYKIGRYFSNSYRLTWVR
jgi:hypothetical protein